MAEAEPVRFDQPVDVVFGGQTITLEPLRGIKRLEEFERTLNQEILDFKNRLENSVNSPNDPKGLMVRAVDTPRLLKLGCPKITDEILEESTAAERLGALTTIARLNNLGHLTVFFEPATLLDIGLRLGRISGEIMTRQFGSPELSANSSEQESLSEMFSIP